MSKHARALVAGLAVLMLVLVACGGKAKTTSSGTPTGGATTSYAANSVDDSGS